MHNKTTPVLWQNVFFVQPESSAAIFPYVFNLVVAIATKEIVRTHGHIPVVISVTESCGFGIVRVMFGIPKRVSSLCFRPCWKRFRYF